MTTHERERLNPCSGTWSNIFHNQTHFQSKKINDLQLHYSFKYCRHLNIKTGTAEAPFGRILSIRGQRKTIKTTNLEMCYYNGIKSISIGYKRESLHNNKLVTKEFR